MGNKICLSVGMFLAFFASFSMAQDEGNERVLDIANNSQMRRYELASNQGAMPGSGVESAHILGRWNLVTAGLSGLAGYFVAPIVKEFASKKIEHMFASRLQFDEVAADNSGFMVYLNEDARVILDEAVAVLTHEQSHLFSLPNMMFYGPPGTGKTMMARNIASKHHLKMITMSASAWFALSTKEAISEMNRLFNTLAQAKTKVLVFIDEADSLLMTRNELPADQGKIITHFLSKTGDLDKNTSFIFATNRADKVDKAMLSRITYKIRFDLPDVETREKLIKQYFAEAYKKFLKVFKTESELKAVEDSIQWIGENASRLAAQIPELSGRDIKQASSRLQYTVLAFKEVPSLEMLDHVIETIFDKIKQAKEPFDSDL